MKNKLLFCLLACIVMVCFSCRTSRFEDQSPNDRKNRHTNILSTPYTDTSVLRQFSTDEEIVDFEFARKIAIIDMSTNKYFETNGWSGGKISDRPVLVYGFDNRPLYYDFIVIDKNRKEVGTVTVHARKRAAMQIHKMSQGVADYAVAKTKSGMQGEIFADLRGCRFAAVRTKAGSDVGTAVNLQTGQITSGLRFMSDDEIMHKMRNEILPQVLGDMDAADKEADAMEERMKAVHSSAAEFWRRIKEVEDVVMSYPEDARTAKAFPTWTDKIVCDLFCDHISCPNAPKPPQPPTKPDPPTPPVKYNLTFTYDGGELFWITQYADWFKKYRSYSKDNFCGPWVAAFILSSNYNKSIDPDLFDKEGYTVQGGAFRGAMTAPCLNNALRDYSNGAITIGMGALSHYDTYWHVREKQASARLLVHWSDDTQWHWTVLYGAYRVDRFLTTNYYFMQADNGTLINNSIDWRKTRNERSSHSYDELQWFDSFFPIWGSIRIQ